MANPGYAFENELLNAIRDKFPNTFAWRFKQSKRAGQPFDLVILPPHMTFIECKSRDISARKTLKLEQLFREGQLKGEIDRAERYGIPAIMSLELRRGRGYPKRGYYTELRNVYDNTIDVDSPGLEPIPRENGEYQIPDDFPPEEVKI